MRDLMGQKIWELEIAYFVPGDSTHWDRDSLSVIFNLNLCYRDALRCESRPIFYSDTRKANHL